MTNCDWLPDVRRQLEAIKDLPEGWDSHGSPPPDIRKLDAAWGLLTYLCQVSDFPKPHVNPTPDGGVQFDWEVGDRYFELEVVAEQTVEYLYRDDSAKIEAEGKMESLDAIVQYIRNVFAPPA